MKITSPFPPRESHLRVMCGAIGLGGGLLGWLLLASFNIEWGFLAVPIGLAFGLVLSRWRAAAVFAYRAVNKLAREFGSVARLWLATLIFMVVVVAGWIGSALPMQQSRYTDTYWLPIEERAMLRTSGPPAEGGMSSILHWIRHTRSWWVALLLPFFLILRVLEPEEHSSSPPENIYTLY